MTAGAKPKMIAGNQHTFEEARQRTFAFWADGGDWEHAVLAKNELVKVVNDLFYESDKHYDDISKPEVKNLLIGHYGLDGEFRNLPECIIETYFVGENTNKSSLNKTFNEKLKELCGAFYANSQLCGVDDKGRAIAHIIGGFKQDEKGNPIESKLEAFRRCGEQVAKWHDENAELTEEEHSRINRALQKYQDSLGAISTYAGFLKEYVEQLPAVQETPKNKVAAEYTHAKVQARTDEFLADDGPWARLINAKEALIRTIDPYNRMLIDPADHVPVPNAEDIEKDLLFKADSPYEKLNWHQWNDLMLVNYGLRGEFGNATQMFVEWTLRERMLDETLYKAIKKTVAAFDASSQLCSVDNDASRKLIEGMGGFERDAQGKAKETKLQAIARCGDNVERWLEHNPQLPEDKKAELTKELADYRQATAEVADYMSFAKEYLKERNERYHNRAQNPDGHAK